MTKPRRRTQTSNLGAAKVPRRRRSGDAMEVYDRLPAPLRAWLAAAILPWSPSACLAIWKQMRAQGCEVTEILAALDAAQCRTLVRHEAGAPQARGNWSQT